MVVWTTRRPPASIPAYPRTTRSRETRPKRYWRAAGAKTKVGACSSTTTSASGTSRLTVRAALMPPNDAPTTASRRPRGRLPPARPATIAPIAAAAVVSSPRRVSPAGSAGTGGSTGGGDCGRGVRDPPEGLPRHDLQGLREGLAAGVHDLGFQRAVPGRDEE